MSRADAAAELDRLLARRNELAQRATAAPVALRLRELRAWQAARLARTYEDLGADPLAGDAVRFFLSDLYGPQQLAHRDQDLTRAWRLLKRALPPRVLEALSMAMELDALSAELDLEMAQRLPAGPLTAKVYAETYRAVGRSEARGHQIGLIVQLGKALARAVRTPLVGLALRAAHGPAHLAGFDALQDFLERGFAAFQRLPDAAELLTTIDERERQLMKILLAGDTIAADEPAAGAGGAA